MFNRFLVVVGLVAVLAIGLQVAGVHIPWEIIGIGGGGACCAMAFPQGFNVVDNLLKVTKALSNGAGTVSSDGIDTGNGPNGTFLVDHDFVIEAPALTTAMLPDDQTMIYHVYHDTDSAFGSETLLYSAAITQTGAGGAGAGAATKRLKLPSDVKQYVRVKAVKAGSGNASTVSLTASLRL